jgi:hypothetical protein
MLDPERMTLAQWFWLVFLAVLFIFFVCRWIDLYTPVEPITYWPSRLELSPAKPIQHLDAVAQAG